MRLQSIVIVVALTVLTPGSAWPSRGGQRGANSAGASAGNGSPVAFVANGWSTSKLISAASGGVLEIEGVARLTIPPGAIQADAVLSMIAELVEFDGQRFVTVSFGPHGTFFSTPATLELWPRLVRRASSASALYYNSGVNPDGSLAWDEEGAPEATDRNGEAVFVISIDHFSTYGVGYDLGLYSWSWQWNLLSYWR